MPAAATTLQMVRWWALDYAYALRWQLHALLGRNDASVYLSGALRPVVVIPGVWETWAFLRPLIDRLHAAGHPVHVVASLGWNGRPVEVTAQDVADYVVQHALDDVVVVTHSKGGLVGKYLMAMLDETGRITSMVAACAPFSGSRYAPYLLLRSLRAFSPRDPTTLLLAGNLEINARITSVYGEFDPHIPEGSELAGAHNVRLATGGHFRILQDPALVALVLQVAAAPRS